MWDDGGEEVGAQQGVGELVGVERSEKPSIPQRVEARTGKLLLFLGKSQIALLSGTHTCNVVDTPPSIKISVTSRIIDIFSLVHPKCIQLPKRLEMSEQRGEVPIRGERGAAQWRERRAGKPGVVRETPPNRHPNFGEAKFG